MRILLQPDDTLIFGQDYHAAAAAGELALAPVHCVGDVYRLPCEPSAISLAVTFNPQRAADAALVASLPATVPVVAHWFWQPSLLQEEEFSRAATVLRNAAAVVVPAVFLREALRDAFGVSSAHVIRSGVDARLFRPTSDEQRREYRRARGIAEDAIIVAHVGRLTAAKGARAVIHLARSLPPGAVLVVRSLSQYRGILEEVRTANPQAVWIEVEDGNRAGHPIPRADAVFVASLSEAAPLVVAEALMSGVPVVTTECTPFYDELAPVDLAGAAIRRIALPARLRGRSADALDLTDGEASQLAERAAREIASLGASSAAKRRARAAEAVRAGLAEQRMLEGFGRLYAHVARREAR